MLTVWVFGLYVSLFFLLGCGAFFSWATVHWGGRLQDYFGERDPKEVVSDEAAGQSLALLAVGARIGESGEKMGEALVAFAAFRFFDIVKPGPVKRLETLGGGYGILLDDLASGAAAFVVVVLFKLIF